ncbi:YcgN family cysteine cluster protein [Xinfangfangia pollutisoli]|uniref:YcgN family cysteine cluster protein n=1 Tax=Xinfangfangia pollutisoli TaxID=2865960 RepID=UPI001CD7BCA0|nr:YcgN family cysteine cluster protein [Xinfangfangia pollutisoli]
MTDLLRPRFWETVPLSKMTPAEWEALCDGCGKCCLNKLEYDDTGEVVYTCVACRLFDNATSGCSDYANRKTHVPECVVLTPKTLKKSAYWMPSTCAYKLLWQGRPLPDWHPLVTGDPDSTHKAGQSMRGRTVSELTVPEEDWEDHLIEESP